ncbi:unnamed protein product [Symbiodinium necroappetens]|uniref:Uncharacterized protein n=1 Tax=Symbiodinium necroappetens TaxID=1628268 RepID=A0A812NX25_9DINO|nr:unnamed protein product [Symbiodinium necroappetens]
MSRVDICHAKSGSLVRHLQRPSLAAAVVLMLAIPYLLLLGSGRPFDVGFIGRGTAMMGCHPHRSERSRIFRQVVVVKRKRSSNPKSNGVGKRRRSSSPKSNGAPYPMVLTSKIKGAKSMAKLKALLENELDTPDFNDIHMSATFTRLAFFNKRQRLSAKIPLWTRLATRLRIMIQKGRITPRGAAHVLWAMVNVHQSMGTNMATAFAPLVQCVQDKAVDMNAFDLSNSIWAAATLQESQPQVLKVVASLARCIPQKAHEMNQQDVSNCLWAAAKLQESEPEVLKAVPSLARCIPQKAHEMNQQEVSDCLWAAAKIQESEPEVLKAVASLARCTPQKANEMNQHALSNCLWAAAKIQESEPEVLKAVASLARCIPQKAHRMSPQDVSNCFWAAAKLQESEPEVLKALPSLTKRISQRVQRMNQVDALQCFVAAAKLQEMTPDVLNCLPAMISQIRRTVAAMDVRELQLAVWAAGELGQYDLKAALNQEIKQRREPSSDKDR